MELIFFLIIAYFLYSKVKKAAGIKKKLTDFQAEDFQQLKLQGTMDLQELLKQLEKGSKKAKSHLHSDSDYSSKNYVSKPAQKPWDSSSDSSSSQDHVHSNSDYTTRNYAPKKRQKLYIDSEKTVRRSLLDQRDSEVTIIRKNYD